MKSFTDISQSKILAKILPIESADMVYIATDDDEIGDTLYTAEFKSEIIHNDDEDDIQCWSLAALLELIQDDIKIEKTLFDQSDLFTYSILSDTFGYRTYEHEELIDACVEMIIKLKEKGLI